VLFNIRSSGRATGAVHGFRANQVKRPAEKVMFADAMWFALNIYGSGMTRRRGTAPSPAAATTTTSQEHTNANPGNARSTSAMEPTTRAHHRLAPPRRRHDLLLRRTRHWMNKADIYRPAPGNTSCRTTRCGT
jgi:hypothetical protein